MPRPKSKSDLIQLSQNNYKKLVDLVNSYPSNEVERDFYDGRLNRNIRDILSHLHHWHLMMLDWYKVGMSGEKPDMPAKGYTWKTLPDLNKVIWETYQKEKLDDVRQLFANSYQRIQEVISSHSDEELFEKKKYHWTGSTSLGAYLISCTCSHYDWAYKRIKKSMKT